MLSTSSSDSTDPEQYPPLLKFPPDAEHGLYTDAEEDHPDTAHHELGPGVQGPGPEEKDDAGVSTVPTCLDMRDIGIQCPCEL